jgi:L-iditol 2-dehydrogenase
MKAVRYIGNGEVAVVEEPIPACPPGGLLVRTEACGLCSGELMAWYMDQKVPHILGHEVAGAVIESDDSRFPLGSRVFPHHHAPCLQCEHCRSHRYVHCAQWKRTKLVPGGMAECFAVGPENLTDALLVDDLRPVDAALIEPLACVVKSIGSVPTDGATKNIGVIGLGVMGLMHALMLPGLIGYDLNPSRRDWAGSQKIDARHPDDAIETDIVFVCPGSQAAFDVAERIVAPGGQIVMFAPLGPGEQLHIPQRAYFRDLVIRHSYSCGPTDTRAAAEAIRNGLVRAEQVISDFVEINDLPEAYQKMKRAQILKPMVVFGREA